MPAADPLSTDALLRASYDRTARTVVLDGRFQGLPDTAHGGTVLALFDAVGDARGERGIAAVYHRRVPLARPLRLSLTRADGVTRLALLDGATPLVTGTSAESAGASPPIAGTLAIAGDSRARPLPVSRLCFACGIDNPLGLHARLAIDDDTVHGAWEPRPALRADDGTLATVALTGLLDEAAFWLGVAASGESGMTTDLRVTLHAPVAFGRRVIVAGARGAVRPRQDDARYWDTELEARGDDGTLMATARITFVAVRGAARKLVAGLLTLNDPAVVRVVFPAYVP
jgi:acyl-coenzyme A thioesterase PaaI-like protein